MPPAEFSSRDFSAKYDQTVMDMEEAIDALDLDIDYETVNQILSITCPDGSQIIVTPQSATCQLWVAARSGGFHFSLESTGWVRTSDGQTLEAVLDTVFIDQAGQPLGLTAG